MKHSRLDQGGGLRQRMTMLALAALFSAAALFATVAEAGGGYDLNIRFDLTKWDVTDYQGMPVLQCKPGKCPSFQRILYLPVARNGRIYKNLQREKISDAVARAIVADMVPEPVKVQSARVRKSGENYLLESNFDTRYSQGTLRNVGRIVITPTRVYGVVGVSPSRATSKSLMNSGFKFIERIR